MTCYGQGKGLAQETGVQRVTIVPRYSMNVYRMSEQGRSRILSSRSQHCRRVNATYVRHSWASLCSGNCENAAVEISGGAVLTWRGPKNFLGQVICTVTHALTPAGVWASEIKTSLHISLWGTVISLSEKQRYPEDYHVINFLFWLVLLHNKVQK